MLTTYVLSPTGLVPAVDPLGAVRSLQFVWADLHAPTDSESLATAEAAIETALGLDVPTKLDRMAFEESARFYVEDGALFLTATLMGHRGEGAFVADAVTFILKQGKLVTVRTIAPRAFAIGEARASARVRDAKDGGAVLAALLEGVVARIADVLQETTRACNRLSARIFVLDERSDFRTVLKDLGQHGTMAALTHESLSSLSRLCAFVFELCPQYRVPDAAIRAIERDVRELERQAESLQTHVEFLMEAALGLTSAAQNASLRTLALATIAFAPATLIASIFGMNFAHLGWLEQPWGPGAAVGLMIAAPGALFVAARWRKWF
jgi:magnesium transporter